VQPDLQYALTFGYVFAPGGGCKYPFARGRRIDELVLGIRTNVTFSASNPTSRSARCSPMPEERLVNLGSPTKGVA
jgi:hypothetical protein